MERDSFVFYKGWHEAIKCLPKEEWGETYAAIIEYGLYGNVTSSIKPIAQAMLQVAKPQIDVNNERYERGFKGGAPKGSCNNPNGRRGNGKRTNQELTKNKPKTNQELTKNKPNVNDNVNDNDNDIKENIYIKENENVQNSLFPTDEQPTPQQPPRTLSEHERLLEYIRNHAPYIATHYKHLITEEEMKKLLREYSKQEIANTIDNIENRQDLRKKYVNLYRTLLNWLKNDSVNKRP